MAELSTDLDPATTEQAKPARGGPRVKLIAAAAGLLVTSLFLVMSNGDFHFLEGAEAGDILLAQGLARGEGYVEYWRLGKPPATVRPPGLSFFFAGLIKAGSFNLFALKFANNLFGGLAFVACFLLLRRRGVRPIPALLMSALCLTLPFWVTSALYLYQGLIYAALALASLWLFETALERRRAALPLAGFAVTMAAAIMLRHEGLALPLAALLCLATRKGLPLRRRLRWGAVVIAAALLSFGAWTVRNYRAEKAQDQPYLSKLMVGEPPSSAYWLAEDHILPLTPQPRALTPALLLQRLQENGTYYLDRSVDLIFPLLRSAPRAVRVAFSLLWFGLALFGIVILLVRRRGISEAFALCALAIVWLWPFHDIRFIAAALPVLILGTHEAWSVLVRRLRLPSAELILMLVFAVILAGNLALDAKIVKQRFQPLPFQVKDYPGMTIVTGRPEAYRSLLLLEEVKKIAPPSARVIFHSPAPCGLIAQRTCSAVPMAGPERIMSFIDDNHIDYVVMDDEGGRWGNSIFSEKLLRPFVERYRDSRLKPILVLRTVPPGPVDATLYQVLPGP